MAGFLLLVSILVLDFSAGLLAILAQALENKGNVVDMITFAEAFLILAHALPYLLGGRAIIFSLMDSTRASISRSLALLSWITVIVGFLLLREGAISDTKSYTFFWFIHLDILAIGGKICFLHGVITIAYYVTAPDPESAYYA